MAGGELLSLYDEILTRNVNYGEKKDGNFNINLALTNSLENQYNIGDEAMTAHNETMKKIELYRKDEER